MKRLALALALALGLIGCRSHDFTRTFNPSTLEVRYLHREYSCRTCIEHKLEREKEKPPPVRHLSIEVIKEKSK